MRCALTLISLAAVLALVRVQAIAPSACYSGSYGDKNGSAHALPIAILEEGGVLYNVTVKNPCIGRQKGVVITVCDDKWPLVFVKSVNHAVVVRHLNSRPALLVAVAFCSGTASPAERGISTGSVDVILRPEGITRAAEDDRDSNSEEDCQEDSREAEDSPN